MPDPARKCVCEAIRQDGGDLMFMDGHTHEHSDFEPFACVEPGCPCEGWRATLGIHDVDPAAMMGPETGQIAPGPPNRTALTIPADALDFSRQRASDAAAHLNAVLGAHTTASNPDEPLAVLALADILENTWPNGIDPLDVLALCIRRLQDAVKPSPKQLAMAALRRASRR